jgi:DNA-binding NarL/FixJ family response regulator
MPGKNGVDSLLEIREQRPDAKVYFMTGYSADDLLKKAMAGGALGVFDKPVDLPRVLDVCAQTA